MTPDIMARIVELRERVSRQLARRFKRRAKHAGYIAAARHGNYTSSARKNGMEPIGFAGHYRKQQA